MQSKVFNFNAGPATLPVEVMRTAQENFLDYKGLGYSISEASHRSPEFQEVIESAEANIRKLMSIPEDYSVLFLQGGASMQFGMIPMNLMLPGAGADYVQTGAWSEKAIKEATLFGKISVIANSKETSYDRIPEFVDWECNADASYRHITSNNTIFGTQYEDFPNAADGVPLIADMSSDIMCKPIDVNKFGLIYAGAQKNLGPSGVTLVIVSNELAARATDNLATMLKYTTHIKAASLYNTPPTFGIYLIKLVTDWLIRQGGLNSIETVNREKAKLLYDTIDADEFYSCPADRASRSIMNVCYRLPNEELESRFLVEAKEHGFVGLKGHRSVGGCRASIYNAMPLAGVKRLTELMGSFKSKNG